MGSNIEHMGDQSNMAAVGSITQIFKKYACPLVSSNKDKTGMFQLEKWLGQGKLTTRYLKKN